jgi:hypothetical protein
MATVNKKFSVKNGLAVDGNVAVSNIASFNVTGPSSASLTFALANVTAATINSQAIITNSASQTLTNKTVGDSLVFNNGGSDQTIYAGGNDFTVYANNDLYLNTVNGDVILQPDGGAYIWSDAIATQTWVGNQGYLTSFSETDPVFTASAASGITTEDISNWDTAFGWGDHSSAGYLTEETDPVFTASDVYGVTSTDISNWDDAYAWGNHAEAGYLTTETDPVFAASDAYGITSSDISNWDTAYGWGDHSMAGYLTTESDPVFTASDAYGITSSDISNWDTAYGWGDHATAGYLTSAVETISNGDDNIVFSASSGTVTANLAANVTISQDLTVTGNLTVNGNTTTLNTETLAVEDNVVLLNKNVTGTPSLDAGIEVERGNYTNSRLYWNETANAWYVSTVDDSANAAVEVKLATLEDVGSLTDGAVISANASATSGAPSVYTWAGATYSTAKFTIQMKQGSDIHVLELLAAVAGSSVYVTEYAEIISNTALGETDVTYDGTDAVLTVTPASGTVVTKIVATLIEA